VQFATDSGRGKAALGISFSHKRAPFRRFETIGRFLKQVGIESLSLAEENAAKASGLAYNLSTGMPLR
jgi:hypothetical protein